MLQIRDVSDRMLYREVMAQQNLLSLVNATVSHELRNPLNSMVGQIAGMEQFFRKFKKVINTLETADSLSKKQINFLHKHLNEIYGGIYTCGQKLTSAAKFVDFFVHDILDYTILNKDEKHFIKQISVFDINTAVQEILDIQKDKASLKNISIRISFIGFDRLTEIKTD
jgi:signal transduction histidine kinase